MKIASRYINSQQINFCFYSHFYIYSYKSIYYHPLILLESKSNFISDERSDWTTLFDSDDVTLVYLTKSYTYNLSYIYLKNVLFKPFV